MAKNTSNSQLEKNESVGEAVSRTENFFKKNGKILAYAGSALIVVAAIIVLLIQFYFNPLKEEAAAQSFTAEQYFRADDFDKALNGDGNSLGFLQIIDEYGSRAGESIYLYAGICELQLGRPAEALKHLDRYSTSEAILTARALACKGDAYVMLEKYENAVKSYLAAASHVDNPYASAYLLKAGIICEELGRNEEALRHYNTIKEKYPQTYEGYEIDKYISRIAVK